MTSTPCKREHVRHLRPSPPRPAGIEPARPPALPDDAAGLRAQRLRVDELLGLASSTTPRPRPGQRPPADATDEDRAAFWAERFNSTSKDTAA
jgi:hypothetical protein